MAQESSVIDFVTVYKFIKRMRADLDRRRDEYRLQTREVIQERLRTNFMEVHNKETLMVQIYLKKMDDLLILLDEIDLFAQDEDGMYINRGQFLTHMTLLNTLQEKVAKLSGTEAARDYALYTRKAALKVKAEQSGIELETAEVSFMDDDMGDNLVMKQAKPKPTINV